MCVAWAETGRDGEWVRRVGASAQPVDLGEFIAERLGHGRDLAAAVVEKHKTRFGHRHQRAVGWAGDAEGDVAAVRLL